MIYAMSLKLICCDRLILDKKIFLFQLPMAFRMCTHYPNILGTYYYRYEPLWLLIIGYIILYFTVR